VPIVLFYKNAAFETKIKDVVGRGDTQQLLVDFHKALFS